MSLLCGAPALATHNSAHAERQIGAIVEQANDDMAAVVDQFAIDAPTALTQTELEEMEDAAKEEIDAIKDDATKDLDDIKKAYSDLGSATQEAKSAVNTAKNLFKTQLKDIADSTVPPGITTTTAPPSPTPPPAPPRTTTTTAPPNPTTTTAPPLPTTTPPPNLIESPGDISGPPEVSASPIDPALKPPPELSSGVDSPGSSAAGLTGTLTNGLSVVLPPTVATAVLSPLIVFEVLLGTLVSSARSLILPSLLLLISWALLMPRRRKPSPEEEAGSEV